MLVQNKLNSQWEVYFDSSYYGGDRRQKPGIPLSIRKDFIWEGRYWLIPEVYACGKGLVIDTCMRVPTEEYKAFQEIWNPRHIPGFTPDSSELDHWYHDNPTNLPFSISATLNGRQLPGGSGAGAYWLPGEAYCMNEAEGAVNHYHLDPGSCWTLWRYSFPWATKRRPKHFSTLVVEMKPDSVSIPGPRFTVSGPGDQIPLTHPETGVKHILTVQEYEQKELPEQCAHFDPEYEFPTHYTGMCYTLKPDMIMHEFSVQDSEKGDPPRPKDGSHKEKYCSSRSILICRVGKDTPLNYGDEGQGRPQGAASSLCFQPKPNILWRSIFFVTKGRSLSIPLL